MNTLDERNLGIDDAIADAVRTYPLAPVPSDMTPAIMSRVHSVTVPPRFQLEWIDLALGFFGASMVGLAWWLWQWMQNLPDWASGLITSTVNSTDPLGLWLGVIGAVGGLVVVGMCLFISLLLLVPGPRIRLQPVSARGLRIG